MEKSSKITKEWIIPENWNDVTIREYQKFWKTIEGYESSPQYWSKVLDRAALHFAGIDTQTLRSLPVDAYSEIMNTLDGLLKSRQDIEIIREFELDGVKYGFIPNLETMSYGEYLDLVNYSKSTWENLPIIMSILYRPIVNRHWSGRYEIESYKGTDDERIKLFSERLVMDITFGAIGFFLNLQRQLLNDTLISLKEEMKMMETNGHLSPDSSGSGVYIKHSLHLLEEMHSRYQGQQKWS